MAQIAFVTITLFFFWLSVFAVTIAMIVIRMRRIEMMEYTYIEASRSTQEVNAIPSKVATSENPILKLQPLTVQIPYKHRNPSEHVAIEIEPDEGPTRIEVHVSRIIKHLQADKPKSAG